VRHSHPGAPCHPWPSDGVEATQRPADGTAERKKTPIRPLPGWRIATGQAGRTGTIIGAPVQAK